MQVVSSVLDVPSGRWNYYECRPSELTTVVELMWQSDGTSWEPTERHFPSPSIELLVNLSGDRFRLLAPDGAEFFDEAWLSGVQSGPVVTEVPRTATVLGVRLRPAGAFALLRRPMWEVSGLVVDLRDVIGAAARELTDRLRDASSVAARFRLAAAWVAERIADAPSLKPEIRWSAAEIERSAGAVPIAELRSQTGLSKTRLVASFRDQIGVPPKRYARIVRFSRAMAILQAGPVPLAEAALAAGYYDQPHMNAEFRDLTGLTPTAFVQQRPDDAALVRS